jgi:hypothetical protein
VKLALYILVAMLYAGELSAQFNFFGLFEKETPPFDYNNDGVIRCLVLAAPSEEQHEDFKLICQDLKQMINGSKPDMPVRVSFEEITGTRTLMGWWYHPDSADQRTTLSSTAYDYIFIAENKRVVTEYPEIFFEGVRLISNHLSQQKTQMMMLMLDLPPSSNEYDNGEDKLTEITYRVADGCGLKVIPAVWAWRNAVRYHVLPKHSLLRKRANCFLSAASIWCHITSRSVPKAAVVTDWVVKKTAAALALAAEDAVDKALLLKHYSRPFKGIVRTDDRARLRYLFYHAGSRSNEALQHALGFFSVSDGKAAEQYSSADWYEYGFDRHACPLDLVCGSIQEMEPLTEEQRYTSIEFVPPELPQPLKVVYNRNPANDDTNEKTLQNLENLLMQGIDFAKKHEMVFIPYQIAWARLWSMNPDYVKSREDKAGNNQLNYMLAGMIYTALTGNYIEPPKINIPLYYGEEQPGGFHRIVSRTGWQCMRQLSTLKVCGNALVSVGSGSLIDRSNPAFVRIRLLEPPQAPVKIMCAATVRDKVRLSQQEFAFDPSNFDIEQVLRCASVSSDTNIFCDLLLSAVSSDSDIDGISRKHTFLINQFQTGSATFSFNTNRVSLSDKSYVNLLPDIRPMDLVYVDIVQNDVETSSLCFSPEYYQPHPICLFPDAQAIESGICDLTVRASSRDRRFDGYEKRYRFQLDYGKIKIPLVNVDDPADNSVFQGPAFVSASASVQSTEIPVELSLYCGRKLLGRANTSSLQAAVEIGAPLSRLSRGEYPLWAAVRLKNGMVVSSEINRFKITDNLSGVKP